MIKISQFISAYIHCALWSSVDKNEEPLDQRDYELSDEAYKKVVSDSMEFVEKAKPYLKNADLAFAGHDFWLTRNRHGAGFWDRPEMYDYNAQRFSYSFYRIKKFLRIKQNSEYLTEIAQSFGEIELYVGDDGKLYFA